MKKIKYNEHLVYILKNTTPYQRMIWLKKAFEFWKTRKEFALGKRKLLRYLRDLR